MPARRQTSDERRAAIWRGLSRSEKRALCLMGPSGAGKTTTLREILQSRGVEARWAAARELVGEMVEALRAGDWERWVEALASDPRPLVLEHAEDLQGRPRTMEELHHLLDRRLSRGHPVLITVTLSAACEDVVAWLSQCADVIRMGRSRRVPRTAR